MKHETLPAFKSSNVEGAKYYPDTKHLVVTYKGGASYTYKSVQPETWAALKKAESKGKFIQGHIVPMHKGERQKG